MLKRYVPEATVMKQQQTLRNLWLVGAVCLGLFIILSAMPYSAQTLMWLALATILLVIATISASLPKATLWMATTLGLAAVCFGVAYWFYELYQAPLIN